MGSPRRKRQAEQLPDLCASQRRYEQFSATWAGVSKEEEANRRARAARLVGEGYGRVWLLGERSHGEDW